MAKKKFQNTVVYLLWILAPAIVTASILSNLIDAREFFNRQNVINYTLLIISAWLITEITLKTVKPNWVYRSDSRRIKSLGKKYRAGFVGMVILPWLVLISNSIFQIENEDIYTQQLKSELLNNINIDPEIISTELDYLIIPEQAKTIANRIPSSSPDPIVRGYKFISENEFERARLEFSSINKFSNQINQDALIGSALTESYAGNYEVAYEYFESAIEYFPKNLDIINPAATIANYASRINEADELYHKSLTMRETLFGKDDINLANTLYEYAILKRVKGALDSAATLQGRSLRIRQENLGNINTSVASSLNNLGQIKLDQDSLDIAEDYFKQALTIRRIVLRENHPKIGETLNNLGVIAFNQSDFANAKKYYEEALDILISNYGDSVLVVAERLNNLGLVYQYDGLIHKAIETHKTALEIKKKLLGPRHWNVAESLNNLGFAYYGNGELEVALDRFQESLLIRREVLPPDHRDIGISLSNISAILIRLGRFDEALSLQLESLKIKKDALGENHSTVAYSLDNLCDLLVNQNRNDPRILEYLNRAWNIRINLYGRQNLESIESMLRISDQHRRLKNFDESSNLIQEAIQLASKLENNSQLMVAKAYNRKAVLSIMDEGSYEDTKEMHFNSLEDIMLSMGINHPEVSSNINLYILALRANNFNVQADSVLTYYISKGVLRN